MNSLLPFKGYVTKNEVVQEVASEPRTLTKEEVLELVTKRHSKSMYWVTNCSEIMKHGVGSENYAMNEQISIISSKCLDSLMANEMELVDGKHYYLYEMLDTTSGECYYGVVGTIDLDKVRCGVVNIHQHEGVIEPEVAMKLDQIQSCKGSISSTFLLGEDDGDLEDTLACLTQAMVFYGQYRQLSEVRIGQFIHRLYKVPQKFLPILSGYFSEHHNFYVADGHHRYNAHKNSNLESMLSVVFPPYKSMLKGYHRYIELGENIDKDVLLKLSRYLIEKFELVESESGEPLIQLLGKSYSMRLPEGESKSYYYTMIDEILYNSTVKKIVPNSKLIYIADEDSIIQMKGDYTKISVIMNPADFSDVFSGKLPAKSTYFYPKPLNGMVINERE